MRHQPHTQNASAGSGRMRRRHRWFSVRSGLAVLGWSLAVACGVEDPTAPVGEIIEETPPVSIPIVEITSPARSAFLTEGTTEDMSMPVVGEACDGTSQVTSVVLNGSPVTLTGSLGCRPFSTSVNSSWGLNVLEGVAANDLGNEVRVVHSYLRSGGYSAAPPAMAGPARTHGSGAFVGIENAWRLRLGQEAIDDGDRTDIDDVWTVLELVMNAERAAISTAIDAALPNPVYDSVSRTTHSCIWPVPDADNRSGVRVNRGSLEGYDWIRLNSLLALDSAVYVDLAAGPIGAPLDVAGYADLRCLGEVGASASGRVSTSGIQLQATVLVEPVADSVEFNVGAMNVTVGTVTVEVSPTGVTAVDNVISTVYSTVATRFSNQLISTATHEFAPAISAALKATLVLDSLAFPTAETPDTLPVTLMVESVTDQLEAGPGYFDYGVAVNVYPASYTKTPAERAAGSILGASTLPAFDGMTGSFGLGVKHDFVNQVFWALWAGGGFDRSETDAIIDSLNAELPPDVTITSMELGLPPVLMPGDTESEVRIGAGGIVIHADVRQSTAPTFAGQPSVPTKLVFNASAFLTGTMHIDQATRNVGFTFADEADVDVEVVNARRTPPIIQLETVLAANIERVLEALLGGASGHLRLPSLPMGDLPGVPAGHAWVLDGGVLTQSSGYLRIVGTVGIGK